jgi:hypothetical protein
MHEVCTTMHASDLSLQCSATAIFPEGQIAVQGWYPPMDPDSSYAVTEGTGTYANVGGAMTITHVDEGLLLTFVLVP